MKPRIKNKWIKALRSGKYVQGTGYLNKDNKYCCLGVLAELHYGEDCWEDASHMGLDNIMVLKAFLNASTLPVNVLDYLKLNELEVNHLVDMNDTGSSFNQIADYIEQNL
jgi:hypothetical protein